MRELGPPGGRPDQFAEGRQREARHVPEIPAKKGGGASVQVIHASGMLQGPDQLINL